MGDVRELMLFGAGDHAAVVADSLGAAWRLVGCWGDDRGRGLPLLGDESAALAAWPDHRPRAAHLAFVGRAGTGARRAALTAWSARGAEWATIVHPTAAVSPGARLGRGVFVGPGAVVNRGAELGDHAVVNSGAVVEHDVVVGLGVHVAPGAVIGGGTRIGDWAWLGLGCRVRDHVVVGAGAIVAMAAAVVGSVEPGTTVAGVPARRFGWKERP